MPDDPNTGDTYGTPPPWQDGGVVRRHDTEARAAIEDALALMRTPEERRQLALAFYHAASLGLDPADVDRLLVSGPLAENVARSEGARLAMERVVDAGWTRPDATLSDHLAAWLDSMGRAAQRRRNLGGRR